MQQNPQNMLQMMLRMPQVEDDMSKIVAPNPKRMRGDIKAAR